MSYNDKEKMLEKYYSSILEHEKISSTLRNERKILEKTEISYQKTENDLKALFTIGKNIGEILSKINDEKFIIKTSNGPRYMVGCAKDVNRNKLVPGARVALDVMTLTIVKFLPSEVDPAIYMMADSSLNSSMNFSAIGGLDEQIRELREVIELPLNNPEIFSRVGISPPKGVLLYGPPGTGKTLLAKAVASTMNVTFIKVVGSALIEKYIGESSRMVREMFNYARSKAPCVIFIDEIDAIGSNRSSESTSSDREVQRTLLELLNQLDGFTSLDGVKIIMATNRPDILDPALLRPGRLDRKIEIGLPSENGRKIILKIHADKIKGSDCLNFDLLSKMTHGFNGADLRNVCTESGMLALRGERDYVVQEDFLKAIRKMSESKKLETVLDYKKK